MKLLLNPRAKYFDSLIVYIYTVDKNYQIIITFN